MTTLEEIKKKYTELGELIAVLEKESTIYATSNNWRVLFFEISISTYGISMNDLKQKKTIRNNRNGKADIYVLASSKR